MTVPATTVFLSHNDSTFVEVTSSVAAGTGINFRRGRSRVLGEWVPGTCDISFRNHLRTLDPTNDSASFQARPGDRVKILVKGTVQWYGWVDSVRVDGYRQAAGKVYSTLTIAGSDDLAWFNRSVVILGQNRTVELTSARVTGLLSDAGYTRATSIATGVRNMSYSALTSINNYGRLESFTSGRTVLELVQEATTVEGGTSMMYIAKDGTFTWANRTYHTGSVTAFGGSGFPMSDIVIDWSDDEFYNSASITMQTWFYEDTSVSTVTSGTGSKSFTLVNGIVPIEAGTFVTVVPVTGASEMIGTVTSFTSATKVLVVNVTTSVDSVAHSSWVVRYTAAGIASDSAGAYNGFTSVSAQTATDAQSVTRHNATKVYAATLPFQSAATALAHAREVAAAQANPSRRVSQFTVELGLLSAADQSTVLGLEIGSAVSVYFDLGTGDPQIVRQTRRIEAVSHSLSGAGSHRVTFMLGLEAIVNFTAVVKQNAATVASTTNEAIYQNRDGIITAHASFAVTAAGTNDTEMKVTPTGLPAAASAEAGETVGTYKFYDASGDVYIGDITWDGTDLRFSVHKGGTVRLGQSSPGSPAFAIANGDFLRFMLMYRAA